MLYRWKYECFVSKCFGFSFFERETLSMDRLTSLRTSWRTLLKTATDKDSSTLTVALQNIKMKRIYRDAL